VTRTGRQKRKLPREISAAKQYTQRSVVIVFWVKQMEARNSLRPQARYRGEQTGAITARLSNLDTEVRAGRSV